MRPQAGGRTAVVGGLCVLLAIGLLPADAYAAPRDPSDGQLSQAYASKADKAAAVGKITGEIAATNGQISHLQDVSELAGERYLKAVADYNRASVKAAAARTAQRRAEATLASKRTSVGQFGRDSYMYGSTLNSSLTLLQSGSSQDMLERAGMLHAAGERQTQSLDAVQRASVGESNADSRARAAAAAQARAKTAAARAKSKAEGQVESARRQEASLQAHATDLQGELVEAQANLSGLVSARKAYLTWKKQQAEIAARKRAAALAAKKRAAELAAKRRQYTLAYQRNLAALVARQRAAAAAQQAQRQAAAAALVRQRNAAAQAEAAQVAESASAPPPARAAVAAAPAPAAHWTAAKGSEAVAAARQWLGTPYAWAGGNAGGPTDGQPPDTGVLGFDCSGLALYGWAQAGIALDHYSGYQYASGSHPSLGALMPGDLLFWSYDGTPATIHHVALYVGNGQVLEAPQSGDVIKIVPLWRDGLVGATRPGT